MPGLKRPEKTPHLELRIDKRNFNFFSPHFERNFPWPMQHPDLSTALFHQMRYRLPHTGIDIGIN